jgi:hypothetical protein
MNDLIKNNISMQKHYKHNIRLCRHNIARINMKIRITASDYEELRELHKTLNDNKIKLRELQCDDDIYYRDYDS